GKGSSIALAMGSGPSQIMRFCLAILNEAAGDLLKLGDFEASVVYLRTEPRAWSYERLNALE
ncbi:hypothetical protein, partial [Serratia marcescens]|uniref:hypothetical protein n=1 Tax=Serratia marcescens TaxID=615 RepID=UPI0013DAF7B2